VSREFGDILLEIGTAALQRQDQCSGAMPGGHNGPYQDPETPVRNTAHWVRAFIQCNEISGEQRFRDAALAACRYLIGDEAPRTRYSFAHRDKKGKDQCNGLIGQAWTIEGLVSAHRSLGIKQAVDIAEEVFLAHPFNPANGLWQRVEPNGTLLSEDLSFNHQLWFAAAGGLLARHASPEVGRRVAHFLECVPALMSVSRRGRIHHLIRPAPRRARRLAARVFSPRRRFNMMIKEVGYQTFNLYAFAMLNEEYPEHAIWAWQDFQLALTWLDTEEFRNYIDQSIFGFPYNPPGFEVPVIFGTFYPHDELHEKDSAAWLQRQLQHGYQPETGLFSGDDLDVQALTARVYECSRFASSMLKVQV